MGYSSRGFKKAGTTKRLTLSFYIIYLKFCIWDFFSSPMY